MRRSPNSPWFALLLQLLLPGLGHVYWKEYVFGLFVFLIMLLAAAIFFVSLLISLSTVAQLALLGLPLVFYLFAFFDLWKSVRVRQSRIKHTDLSAITFLIIGIAYQVFSPSAPINLVIHNHPTVSRISDTHLAPFVRPGQWIWVNRAAYSTDVMFLSHTLLHDLPAFTDLIAYHRPDSTVAHGMVIAGMTDAAEVNEGILYINGSPVNDLLPPGVTLAHDLPLTTAGERSILVATFSAGALSALHVVSLADVIGKVHRLL